MVHRAGRRAANHSAAARESGARAAAAESKSHGALRRSNHEPPKTAGRAAQQRGHRVQRGAVPLFHCERVHGRVWRDVGQLQLSGPEQRGPVGKRERRHAPALQLRNH